MALLGGSLILMKLCEVTGADWRCWSRQACLVLRYSVFIGSARTFTWRLRDLPQREPCCGNVQRPGRNKVIDLLGVQAIVVKVPPRTNGTALKSPFRSPALVVVDVCFRLCALSCRLIVPEGKKKLVCHDRAPRFHRTGSVCVDRLGGLK